MKNSLIRFVAASVFLLSFVDVQARPHLDRRTKETVKIRAPKPETLVAARGQRQPKQTQNIRSVKVQRVQRQPSMRRVQVQRVQRAPQRQRVQRQQNVQRAPQRQRVQRQRVERRQTEQRLERRRGERVREGRRVERRRHEQRRASHRRYKQHRDYRHRTYYNHRYRSTFYSFGFLLPPPSYPEYVVYNDDRFYHIDNARIVDVNRRIGYTLLQLDNGWVFELKDPDRYIHRGDEVNILAQFYDGQAAEYLLVIDGEEFPALRL